MKLEKSKNDLKKLEKELKDNKILKWVTHRKNFKFNVGDVLVKLERQDEDDEGNDLNVPIWIIEKDDIGAPVKYVYAFENDLGIGYVKGLDNNGKGPGRRAAVCVVTFDHDYERFQIDPEYADHILIGDGEFQYNEQYEQILKTRNEAIAKNKLFMVDLSTNEKRRKFWKSLKVGTKFWSGHLDNKRDPVFDRCYEVVKLRKDYENMTFKTIEAEYSWEIGDEDKWTMGELLGDPDNEIAYNDVCVSMTKPLSLKPGGNL